MEVDKLFKRLSVEEVLKKAEREIQERRKKVERLCKLPFCQIDAELRINKGYTKVVHK